MSCAYDCIKWLMFIFNFIFSLIAIAILAIGIWACVGFNEVKEVSGSIHTAGISFIVIGLIIFVIAFFGCCGAIRESHCMVITFAVFLLTILVIQVAFGIFAFVVSTSFSDSGVFKEFTNSYRNDLFANYWDKQDNRNVVDGIQNTFLCCGVEGPFDFDASPLTHFNGTIPWSCCGNEKPTFCTDTKNIYQQGCISGITSSIEKSALIFGGVAIGVAATELIGIIFAFCLANSIRNDYRRGYRV